MIPTILRHMLIWPLRLIVSVIACVVLAVAIGATLDYTEEMHCADASLEHMQGKILVFIAHDGLRLTDIRFHGKPEFHPGKRDTWHFGLHTREGNYFAVLDCRGRMISFAAREQRTPRE